MEPRITVLTRSEHDLVVIKPAGVACELGSDPRGVSLVARLARQLGLEHKPWLVHRLDRMTAGLLLVALTAEAAGFHGSQLRARAWCKLYLARIRAADLARARGVLVGSHRCYLAWDGRRARRVRAGGSPARLEILEVEPCPTSRDQAHVLLRLHTGRRHQVRVMLAEAGYPLVGDRLYGGAPGSFYLEHVVLGHLDFVSRRPVWHLLPEPSDREPVSPELWRAVARAPEQLGSSQ